MDAELWAITPDDAEDIAKMAAKKELTFPILLEKDLEATRAFGILNEKSGEVPHPTVVVIDKSGVIRFFHLDENYSRRPDPEVILEAVRKLPKTR